MDPKINFVFNEQICKTHRSGWKYVSEHLSQLHHPSGVLFYSWLDRGLKTDAPFSKPWTGILHNPVSYPSEYPRKYRDKILPLNQLVNKIEFTNSLASCKGIFTLSRVTANFLRAHVAVPVVNLWHPSIGFARNFKPDVYLRQRRLVFIGQWMRRFHSFLELDPAGHDKWFVKIPGFESDYEEMNQYAASTTPVTYVQNLSNEEYDDLLTSSVVYLDLYDVAACNTIIECIMMNCPILVNRLPGAEEYLGEHYPLFFDNPGDAERKLADVKLVLQAHLYLQNMDKSFLDIRRFMHDLQTSPIYSSLKSVSHKLL